MSQHMEALAHANEIRLARAALKREIKAGDVLVLDVLADVPCLVASMPVYELLKAQRRWGHARILRVMGGCNLSEGKRLGQMTERQRRVLRDALA